MSSREEATEALGWQGVACVSVPAWMSQEESATKAEACVEYIGRTALVVTGPYTGARYRFLQPGARITVDARDRQAMLSIPMLRAVATLT